MKTSLVSFSIALLAALLTTGSWADQQLGAQVRTIQPFGYGKLVMTLVPSTEPGIVNGFFMLKYFLSSTSDAAYPNGWTEVDYEYVPGNAMSSRRTATGDCGPTGTTCVVGTLGSQSAANFISINIIGGPLSGSPPADSQVFYKLTQSFFQTMNTYQIEFNPDQIKWGANGINQNKAFMYQKAGTNNNDIHQSLGMQNLVGRNMYIWFNIYSGLGGAWGGSGLIPQKNTQMIIKNVAFYPVTSCQNGSCQYSSTPSMSSDFVNDKYTLNGAESSFKAIWLNQDSTHYPVYTRAANATVVRGMGLVMKYTYSP
jgi:hypothetical protein